MMHSHDENTNNEQEEMPLASLLPFLLKCEDFADVKLEGKDGVQVAANRYVLAFRSAVFRKMLLGPFRDAKDPIVKLDYNSDVLQALVEYCYTDTVELLLHVNSSASAMTYVSLMQAADFFGLGGLIKKIKVYAKLFCLKISSALEFLQAFKSVEFIATEATSVMADLAIDTIRNASSFAEGLDENTLACIDSSVLETILEDRKMQATESAMFLLLKAWAQAPGLDWEELWERREKAKQLMKHVRLQNICPSNLTTVVEMSGLVTREQLEEARESQALRHGRPIFEVPRRAQQPRVWTDSQTNLLSRPQDYRNIITFSDKLDYPPMKSGVHKWKLQVQMRRRPTLRCEVGVMLPSCDLELNRSISHSRHGWGYSNRGDSYHNDQRINQSHIPRYYNGSTVTLTLDLRPRNGTLSASIDDGASFELFNNMLAMEEVTSMGLVPAASVEDSATVRILEIDRIDGTAA